MVNYQLGKIYKIVDLSTDECYVGSTCQPTLAKRLQGHVRQYRQYSKGKMRFTTSFLIIANKNYDIELIEDYPCDSKVELHKRERYHTTSRACVNKNKNQGLIAELGDEAYNRLYKQEYRAKYKGKIADYRKVYNEIHKEEIRFKRTVLNHCDCGGSYQTSNKSRHMNSLKHNDWLSQQIVCTDCKVLI